MVPYLNFDELTVGERYKALIDSVVPRPIAWVTTMGSSQQINLAPFSFFTALSSNPPLIAISIANKPDGSLKDTLINILDRREFCINMAHEWLIPQINQSSADYDYETSEMSTLGLHTKDSILIKTPALKESLLNMECLLDRTIELGPKNEAGAVTLVIGKVLGIQAEEKILGEKNRIQFDQMKPASRLGGLDWGIQTIALKIDRPTK